MPTFWACEDMNVTTRGSLLRLPTYGMEGYKEENLEW
jgi:hypothetical protein